VHIEEAREEDGRDDVEELEDLVRPVADRREPAPAQDDEGDQGGDAGPVVDLVRDEPRVVELRVAVWVQAVRVWPDFVRALDDEGEGVQEREDDCRCEESAS